MNYEEQEYGTFLKRKSLFTKRIPDFDITTSDSNKIFQGIPAEKITAGTLKSENGRLIIDLVEGTIITDDGVEEVQIA